MGGCFPERSDCASLASRMMIYMLYDVTQRAMRIEGIMKISMGAYRSVQVAK